MSRLTPALTLSSARAMEAKYRKLNMRTGLRRVQKRVGWLWHSPGHHSRGSRTWFTTNLESRAYPDDAVFVPVWADCDTEGQALETGGGET